MEETIQLVDASKLNVNTVPRKVLKKAGLVWRKKNMIWNELDKLERQNMRKYHSAIQTSAIFEWICNRCVIQTKKGGDRFEDSWVIVHLKDYEKMKKRYSKNKVNSPYDLGVKEIPFLLRIFAEGNVSEC